MSIDDIEFKDETDKEFKARMIEVKKKWAELDAKMPLEEIFRREAIYKEAQKNLEETPELIDYLEDLFPKPNFKFEQRIGKFKNARK